jgi:molybdopterin-synthase adenylyltransferase
MTKEQIIRYSRQLLLPEIGKEGQEKLLIGRVLVIGAGGLGSPALYYLAAAGIGTLGIADKDTVELSNLNRQIIHFTDDLKKDKAASAAEKVTKLNPDVRIHTYGLLDRESLADVIRDYDIVIDGTDTFDAKFGVNDICVKARKPFVHAGVIQTKGQVLTWVPGSACYRCVFKTPPEEGAIPSCEEAGVLGATAGVIGTIQAAEAIKFILGKGELLTNRLLTFDAMDMEFRTISVVRDPVCPVCGTP